MDSDIEKVKAFHNMQPFVDDDTSDMLIKKLGLTNSNLEMRLPGLKVEDEFALILYFLDNCKHIITIDETTAALTDSNQSDFIVHFKDNKKIMFEVKSTSKNKYKISKSNFEKKVDFAKDMGLELYFALKVNDYWGIYDTSYLISKSYQITNDAEDMKHSVLNSMLNCKMFIIPKDIEIESIYAKDAIGLGIAHTDYGNLISYKLSYQNQLILDLSSPDSHLTECLTIELWHDFMSQNQSIEVLDNNQTKVIERSNENFLNYDFQYFLSSINHIVDEFDRNYDSSSFLKSVVSRKRPMLTKAILIHVLDKLKRLGIPIQFARF